MAPKPQYFIVRRSSTQGVAPNGKAIPESSIVPLIPVDLLPEWVDIQGIPRRLSLAETAGMTNLGSFSTPNEVLKLRFLSLSQSDNANGTSLSGGSEEQGSGEHLQQHDSHSSSGATSHTLRDTSPRPVPIRSAGPPSIARNAELDIHFSAPRGPRAHDLSYKVKACQAWCHHGKCPRGSSCHSRHQMPQTLKGLTAVGLDDFPFWYKAIRHSRGKVPASPKGLQLIKKEKKAASLAFEISRESDKEVTDGAMEEAKSGMDGGEVPKQNGAERGDSDDDLLLIDM